MKSQPFGGRLTPSDIVELAGVAPSTVSNWRKRHEDFPQPVGGAAGRPVFDEQEIRSWLTGRGIQMQSSRTAASLVTRMLDEVSEQMSPETATLVIHQVLALRFLCAGSESDRAIFAEIDSLEAVAAFAWLQAPEKILAPQELIPHNILNSGLAVVVRTVAALSDDELVETSDAVLRKLTGGRARGGGESGLLDSRATRLLQRAMWIQDSFQTIYDPACGIGQLLLESVKHQNNTPRVVGVEISSWAATIARIRFLLRGIEAEIHTADSLGEHPIPELLADVVVVEPPVTGSKDRAYEWLAHAVKHLAPEGLGLVLTRKRSLSEAATIEERRQLVESGVVQGVIELPNKLLQHTSTALALWMLRAPKLSPEQLVFVDGSGQQVPEDWIQGWVEDIDLNEESEPLRSRQYARASVAELFLSNMDLTPSLWVANADRKPSEIITRYERVKHDFEETVSDREFAFDTLPRATEVMTIGKLETEGHVVIDRGTVPLDLGRDLPEGAIDVEQLKYVAAMQSASGGASLRRLINDENGTTQDGDVLIVIGAKPIVAIEDHGPHLITKDIVLVRADIARFDPHYLVMCFEAPWNQRSQPGSSQAQIIRDMEIPILSLSDQHEWVKEIRALQNFENALREATNSARNFQQAALNLMSFGKEES